MNDGLCVTCLKPKAPLQCKNCASALCKTCARFLDEEEFSYMAPPPADLQAGAYCSPCFEEKVLPEIETYQQIMERAKNVYVFYREQGKETRLFKRTEAPIKIENASDEKDALMRLAFIAAQKHYNAVIDIVLNHQKVKSGSYQTTIWSGTGVPTEVDGERLDRKIEPKNS